MDLQGQKMESSSSQTFSLSPEWCHEDRVEEYKSKMEIFLATKLFFPLEDMEKEHWKLKSIIFPSARSLDSNIEQLKRETESEVDDNFSYFKQDNLENRHRCSQLEKIGSVNCAKKFDSIQQTLFSDMTTRPLDNFYLQSAENFYKHFEQFVKALPTKWGIYMNGWYRSEVDAFLADMKHLLSIVKQYSTDMGTLLKKKICLEPQLFDKEHTRYLQKAKSTDKNYQWTKNHLRSQMFEIIEKIRALFYVDNREASKQETKLISQALIHAENAYNQTMESKIRDSVPRLTSNQIQEFHELCKTAVVESFARIPTFTYSSHWELEADNLSCSLTKHLAKHLHECTDTDTPCALKTTKVAVAVLKNESVPTSKPVPKHEPVPRKTNTPTYQPKSTYEPRPVLAKKQAPKLQPAPAPTQQRPSSSKVNEVTAPKPLNSKPYGLGIFISSDIVNVGIYQNYNKAPIYYLHPPFITLKNGGIEYFKKEESSSKNFNIIKILKDAQKVSQSLLISNQTVNLRAEEIVGLFFQKLKSKAASVVEMEDFKSCVVAVSALWGLSSKQMLKNSLLLAGFEKCQLIHTTTSIGLSYLLKSRVQFDDYVALVHQHSAGFDVALAQSSSSALIVKRIYANESLVENVGWVRKNLNPFAYFAKTEETQPDSDEVKLSKIVNNMLTALGVKEKQLKHSIFTTAKAMSQKQETLFKDIFKSSKLKFVDEEKSIVLGAAALSARCNGNVLKILECKEVFPYTLITKINEMGSQILVRNNAPLEFTKRLFAAADGKTNNSNILSIYELSGPRETEETLIGKYSMDTYNSTMGRPNVQVNLTSTEGLIEVKLEKVDHSSPASLRIQTNFMTPPQLRDATANMSLILLLINGN